MAAQEAPNANPLAVDRDDHEIDAALAKGIDQLVAVKNDMIKRRKELEIALPFHNADARTAAFDLLLRMMETELLLMRLIRRAGENNNPTRRIELSEAWTVDQIVSVATIPNWFMNVFKQHGEHVGSACDLAQGFLKVKGRMELAREATLEKMKCEIHPDLKAFYKDLATGKNVCLLCALEKGGHRDADPPALDPVASETPINSSGGGNTTDDVDSEKEDEVKSPLYGQFRVIQ